MTLQELFVSHPFIAWSLVAFVAAELVAAGVIVVRLFRKPRSDKGDKASGLLRSSQ